MEVEQWYITTHTAQGIFSLNVWEEVCNGGDVLASQIRQCIHKLQNKVLLQQEAWGEMVEQLGSELLPHVHVQSYCVRDCRQFLFLYTNPQKHTTHRACCSST